jgi:type III secretion protein J
MKRFFLIFLLLFFAAGCGEAALNHTLQEIEADEILVTLNQNNIQAAKKREEGTGQEVSWMVTVKSKDENMARQILRANNLPRKRELGLSGVYKEKGLIPTPDEQKARFLLALKGEIINSLLKIPGVVDVDVVLNVPNENEFADLDPVKRKPTASVVVRTRNDEMAAQTVTEGKIQRFVANTVPNLDANDVAVIVSRADTGAGPAAFYNPTPTVSPNPVVPFPEDGEPIDLAPLPTGNADVVSLAGLKLDRASVGRFKFYIIGLLLLLVGVSGFLLFNIMRLNRMRLRVQRGMRAERGTLAAGGGSAGLLGEGPPGAGAMEGTFDVGAEQRRG